MFKRKKKIELTDEELRILFYALTDFRNDLLNEGKYADPVNEVMVKLKNKMKVDKYDLGLMINGLYKSRKNKISQEQDTAHIDELLLRLIDIHDNFKK